MLDARELIRDLRIQCVMEDGTANTKRWDVLHHVDEYLRGTPMMYSRAVQSLLFPNLKQQLPKRIAGCK